MHLNSGLLLRKPGESAYAAARHFAIANRALNYQELIKMARECLSPETPPITRAHRSQIGRLAHNIETDHCQTYGIVPPRYPLNPPYPFTNNPSTLAISRNCATCAAAIYHSPLFELPWLIECPIHHSRLTSACPSCGKGWPTIAQIWAHSCPMCGVKISRDALVHASNCTTTWDFSALQLLQRGVDYHYLWDGMLLHAGEGFSRDPSEMYTHLPITPHHCFFPSVVSDFDPAFGDFCKAHQIYSEPCIRFTFTCAPFSPDKLSYNPGAPTPAWITDCRRKACAKISGAVARCAGSGHNLKRKMTVWSEGGRPIHCAFCEAYNCWRRLIEKLPLQSSQLFEWTITVAQNLGTLPPTPKPMHLITTELRQFAHDKSSTSQPSRHIETTHHCLPLTARRLFYSLDLWTTFVALFESIELAALHASGQIPVPPLSTYSGYTPNFNESISQAIAFWKTDTGELHVRVPQSLMQPRLRTTHAARWQQACANGTDEDACSIDNAGRIEWR
jgi:predicted RNA-binding Zn-ribbon protein involved in translation (DUF1610 family)